MKNLENLSINDYLNIIRRRIGYVVVITALVSVVVVAWVRKLPSIYKSETTILVAGRIVPEEVIQSIDRQSSSDQIDFVRQQLKSRSFLEQMVQEFHFAKTPGPQGVETASAMVAGNTDIQVLTTTTFKLGFFSPDARLAQAVTRRLAEKVTQLNETFRKDKTKSADQFLEEQSHEAANALSDAEAKMLEYRERTAPGFASEVVTPETLRDLQAQFGKLETSLDDMEAMKKSLARRLEEHRQLQVVMKSGAASRNESASPEAGAPAAAAVPAGPPSPLEQTLATKKAELASALSRYTTAHPDVVRLQQEVRDLEALVRQSAPAPKTAAAPAATAAAQAKEAVISAPLPELGSIDLFTAEIQQEMEQVNQDQARAEQNKKTLLARIAAYQERLNPSVSTAGELGALTRSYDQAKQRYLYLSDKHLNSQMAARVDASDNSEMFKILEPAFFPLKPVKPDRRLLALVGTIAGLVVGLGAAFLRDFMDPAFHDEDDLANELQLPVLASIPQITPSPEDKKRHAVRLVQNNREGSGLSLQNIDPKVRDVLLNPLSPAGEPYRLLHSTLAMMQKDRGLRTLLVSSAVPGEGKTFTACCLAGTLAHEPGKKVLLIDADLRRSNATNILGLGNRKFAHTFGSLLRGEADIEQSTIQFNDSNLWFLPSGNMVSNPLETLSSPQLERVLRHFTEVFDWVIVDSPPILAVADTNLMLPLCDGMIHVVYAGKTAVKLVKDSIKRIGRDRICGLLMNQTQVIQSSYYYGYDGYQPSQRTTRFAKRTDAD